MEDRLLDMCNTLRELLYMLAPKCPRCRDLMALELKPLRDEWGRRVYRLVLVCYKCNYELASSVILSEKGA
jgi:C4-type Zn-finger protein